MNLSVFRVWSVWLSITFRVWISTVLKALDLGKKQRLFMWLWCRSTLSKMEYEMERLISLLAQASFLIVLRFTTKIELKKLQKILTSVKQMLDILRAPDVHKQPCYTKSDPWVTHPRITCLYRDQGTIMGCHSFPAKCQNSTR